MRQPSLASLALFLFLLLHVVPEEVSGQFWAREGAKEKGDHEEVVHGGDDENSQKIHLPVVKLSNDNTIPLVGLGVGNLQHYVVPLMVAGAIQDDKRTRLIDTSHISDNEHLVAEGIQEGMERVLGGNDRIVTIHVVTKVWYTYLGYERTKLSIRESFQALKSAMDHPRVDLKVHILLHWPRCYDNISWMSCQEDEARTPHHIKAAGPPPHQDKDAWKGSWKALEEAYLGDEFPIRSIGVANFHLKDMEELEELAQVQPHILQLNVWSLLYDSQLIDYCYKHGIHVQVYSILNGIVTEPQKAPNAFHHLQKVASELTDDKQPHSQQEQEEDEVSPAQVVLAWLVQHGVSIVPRTSRLSRLKENSAVALASVPDLSVEQVETVAHSVEAFLSEDDLEKDIHVKITFHATTKDTFLYWNTHDGGEIKVAFIPKGESFNEMTYPNHSFRLYDARNKDHFIEYKVDAKFGSHEHVHAEL
ncbi:Probable NAD(P)H-dependent D-xylose reductase xyl1 [Seminavis robusta]|uniref:Probable NAD(P)H-dependent D-xylose reductase xyl1 n=1 Tax=Seminavis robusta TaxID=568900 RepID=A0A9N8HDU4_9STRA|nr:Probable NAD(P)H-dependent D-xylose reductase xyl1 [Seminavis robusta]|eukprot:Sro376_g129850.1 Probable NAD(P)H-dependent D-xylose reductase xyl1 (475) ;mRNA; r:63096-64520